MSVDLSEKELAYLHDLVVTPDWSERFAALIDEHVKLPKSGNALYAGSGTGAHALLLAERGDHDLRIVCVDENEQCTEIAREKAVVVNSKATFRCATLDSIEFNDETFDLVIGDLSMLAPNRLGDVLAELIRVAAPRATVAFALPTAYSFGEFFSIYWEAMLDLEDHEHDVESLIEEMPTVSHVEEMCSREGLSGVRASTSNELFEFANGREFIEAPLIKNFLMPRWLSSIYEEKVRDRVNRAIARLIDDDRHDVSFQLSMKATVVVGKKS